MNDKEWILASNSPRRRELFALFNKAFQVAPADVDESRIGGESPAVYGSRLAEKKARAAAKQNPGSAMILASDTTVADGDEILGKPEDAAHARAMLKQLRGRTHQVNTAITLHDPLTGETCTELCVSDVKMRDYTDEEIDAYIQSGDPMDKAGSYAIQNPEFHPADAFGGCFASVMGLPICHLRRAMAKMGYPVEMDNALVCKKHLHYDCSIHAAVLAGENIG